MDKFISSVKNFAKDEEGLTVVEYVIGAALLVAGLVIIFDNLGSQLSSKLNNTINNIS
ncbi:Flp family type IVb pilin [Vibrio breoganii]